MALIDGLKAAGFRFTKRAWPTITVLELSQLGISPKRLNAETRTATLAETMGPNWKYGFHLKTGAGILNKTFK